MDQHPLLFRHAALPGKDHAARNSQYTRNSCLTETFEKLYASDNKATAASALETTLLAYGRQAYAVNEATISRLMQSKACICQNTQTVIICQGEKQVYNLPVNA